MTLRLSTTAIAALLCAPAFLGRGLAQGAPVILEIDVENQTKYFQDTADVSKYATDPGPTTIVQKNFEMYLLVGDIVAVNGQPAKGTVTSNGRMTNLRPAPGPGDAMADTTRNTVHTFTYEILSGDGTPVGALVSSGQGGGPAAPGTPLEVTGGNNIIVGGSGAFFGARGQAGGVSPQPVADRLASMTEDPSNRRKFGGGKQRHVLMMIPFSQPQIVNTPNGPAIAHAADFSLVTASKPAVAGEILSLFATGLGPTRPGINPGQPFPASPLAFVNSPVEVMVNDKPAEVIGAAGFPGSVDSYQVNFRVPPDAIKGPAAVRVKVAWVPGPPANIMVQ